MNTLTKCEYIENFSRICIEEKIHSNFVTYNDLGVPLAIAVVAEIADLKGHGKEIIDETFSLMCELLELDPDVEYADFDDFMAGSNYQEGTED